MGDQEVKPTKNNGSHYVHTFIGVLGSLTTILLAWDYVTLPTIILLLLASAGFTISGVTHVISSFFSASRKIELKDWILITATTLSLTLTGAIFKIIFEYKKTFDEYAIKQKELEKQYKLKTTEIEHLKSQLYPSVEYEIWWKEKILYNTYGFLDKVTPIFTARSSSGSDSIILAHVYAKISQRIFSSKMPKEMTVGDLLKYQQVASEQALLSKARGSYPAVNGVLAESFQKYLGGTSEKIDGPKIYIAAEIMRVLSYACYSARPGSMMTLEELSQIADAAVKSADTNYETNKSVF